MRSYRGVNVLVLVIVAFLSGYWVADRPFRLLDDFVELKFERMERTVDAIGPGAVLLIILVLIVVLLLD